MATMMSQQFDGAGGLEEEDEDGAAPPPSVVQPPPQPIKLPTATVKPPQVGQYGTVTPSAPEPMRDTMPPTGAAGGGMYENVRGPMPVLKVAPPPSTPAQQAAGIQNVTGNRPVLNTTAAENVDVGSPAPTNQAVPLTAPTAPVGPPPAPAAGGAGAPAPYTGAPVQNQWGERFDGTNGVAFLQSNTSQGSSNDAVEARLPGWSAGKAFQAVQQAANRVLARGIGPANQDQWWAAIQAELPAKNPDEPDLQQQASEGRAYIDKTYGPGAFYANDQDPRYQELMGLYQQATGQTFDPMTTDTESLLKYGTDQERQSWARQNADMQGRAANPQYSGVDFAGDTGRGPDTPYDPSMQTLTIGDQQWQGALPRTPTGDVDWAAMGPGFSQYVQPPPSGGAPTGGPSPTGPSGPSGPVSGYPTGPVPPPPSGAGGGPAGPPAPPGVPPDIWGSLGAEAQRQLANPSPYDDELWKRQEELGRRSIDQAYDDYGQQLEDKLAQSGTTWSSARERGYDRLFTDKGRATQDLTTRMLTERAQGLGSARAAAFGNAMNYQQGIDNEAGRAFNQEVARIELAEALRAAQNREDYDWTRLGLDASDPTAIIQAITSLSSGYGASGDAASGAAGQGAADNAALVQSLIDWWMKSRGSAVPTVGAPPSAPPSGTQVNSGGGMPV